MAEPLTPDALGEPFRSHLSTQSYAGGARIDGVRLIDLRLLSDDGGSFAELARLTETGELESVPGFQVRQSSYSLILPGAIKAFHLHFHQDDVWFVPPDNRLLVGLIDARAASPTFNQSMRLVMGGGRAQLLHIPRGVGHGCANLAREPATVVYFVNQQFNLADPDERRLPFDCLGASFWEMTPG